MSKYTKTIANTPKDERPANLKGLKTSIHNHTGFGSIDDPSKSLPINSESASGYSSEVVSLAGQLKYQHEQGFVPSGEKSQKFSDDFYLQYAKRQIDIKSNALYDVNLNGMNLVPDPAYAQYSYEEIIEMSNNGVNIPKAVLAWARSQQEADVVDYIVISENSDNPAENENGETDVNKIRSEVRNNTVKSKKAQEDIKVNKNKTNDLTYQAEDISKEQKKLFNNHSIDKTEQMVKEWKELDKKKKDEGKLSDSDNAKYKKLSKKLQKNGEIIKDIKLKSASLEDFLESINDLNVEVNEGIITAQKTINSATGLTNIDDKLNFFDRVHTAAIRVKDSGMLADALNNIEDAQLAYVSTKIGQDLENFSNDTFCKIHDFKTQDVVEFATTYVNKANNIENILGINEEDDENSENKTQKEDKFEGSNTLAKGLNDTFENNKSSNTSNPFGFLFSFMSNPEVAVMFTVGTLLSSGVTLAESTALNAESLVLAALAAKEKKADEKLQKAAEENAEKFEANSEKITENEDKMVELDEQTDSAENEQPDEVESMDDLQNKIDDNQSTEENDDPEIESKKAPIAEENEVLKSENSLLVDKVKSPLEDSAAALSRSRKYLKRIDSNSKILKADTKELIKLSNNTAQIGAESLKAGMSNIAITLGLFSAGGAMLSNPVTHAMGLFLIETASVWDTIAYTQVAGGIAATAGAITGIATAEVAQLQNNVTDTIIKSVTGANKESKALITETAKTMGNLEVPAEVQNDEQPTTDNNAGEENAAPVGESADNTTQTQDNNPQDVQDNVIEAEGKDTLPAMAMTRAAAAPQAGIALEAGNGEEVLNAPETKEVDETQDGEEVLNAPETEKVDETQNGEEVLNAPETAEVDETQNGEEVLNVPETEEVDETQNSKVVKEPEETSGNEVPDGENSNIQGAVYAPARAMTRAAAINNGGSDNTDIPETTGAGTETDTNFVENTNNSGEEFSQNPSQDENSSDNTANAQTEPDAELPVESESVLVQKPEEIIENTKDDVMNAVAMGKQPQDIVSSLSNVAESNVDGASSTQVNRTDKANTTDKSQKSQKSQNDEQKTQKKEKTADHQKGLKAAYGVNIDFASQIALGSIAGLIGLGPTTFVAKLVMTAAQVALSVLDLFVKSAIVDKSQDVTEKDVNSSNDAVKSLIAESNKIKSEHDKNVAQAKAFSNEFEALKEDSTNYQSEMMQKQATLVEAGKMSPDEVTEFADPNEGAKNAIYSKVSKISANDSKLLSTISAPTAQSEKALKVSQKSLQGSNELNDKLVERNENNSKVGDVVIGEAAIAQGLITALVATLLACGPWCWAYAAMWAVALASNAAYAAVGVGAKIASNKVDGDIAANNKKASDSGKAIGNSLKQMNDVRKVMAKAGRDKMGNLPPQEESSQAPEQNQDKSQTSGNASDENSNNGNTAQNNDSNVIRLTSFSNNKDMESRADFGTSLSADDMPKVNNFGDVQEPDEKSKAAASTSVNVSFENDTTSKSDVKLAKFNKSGALDSSKRAKKVNATSASHNGRKRR